MIADWFAAIGTVGALLLALALLYREIMRGRRAPVDALVVWIDTVSRPRAGDVNNWWVYRITAYNSSEAPVPAVSIRLATKSRSAMRTVRLPPVAGPAEFAGKAKERVEIDTDWDLFTFGVPTLFVRDWSGEVWQKNLFTGRVRRRSIKWASQRALLV